MVFPCGWCRAPCRMLVPPGAWRWCVMVNPGGAGWRVGPCYTCASRRGRSRLGTLVLVGGCRLAGWTRVGVGWG